MTGKKVADIPPRDMAEITAVAPLVNAMPYFEAEIRKMQGQVIHATMALHEGGDLTPELALQKWHEFITQEKLLRRLQTKIRVSTTVAEKYSDKMTEKLNG